MLEKLNPKKKVTQDKELEIGLGVGFAPAQFRTQAPHVQAKDGELSVAVSPEGRQGLWGGGASRTLHV